MTGKAVPPGFTPPLSYPCRPVCHLAVPETCAPAADWPLLPTVTPLSAASEPVPSLPCVRLATVLWVLRVWCDRPGVSLAGMDCSAVPPAARW